MLFFYVVLLLKSTCVIEVTYTGTFCLGLNDQGFFVTAQSNNRT